MYKRLKASLCNMATHYYRVMVNPHIKYTSRTARGESSESETHQLTSNDMSVMTYERKSTNQTACSHASKARTKYFIRN